LVNKLNKIFNSEEEPIVRELTFMGATKDINNVYDVQQTTSDGIKNYFISATEDESMKISYYLSALNSKDVYLYLKSRLLVEPFIEDDLEKVLEICKVKLPKISVREYSIFME